MNVSSVSYQTWPVAEFRKVVAQLNAQILCSSCKSFQKTLFQEVMSKTESEVNRDFPMHARRIYEFVFCPAHLTGKTSCLVDQPHLQTLFSQFARAYPYSVLGSLFQSSSFDSTTTLANILAYLYFASVSFGSPKALEKDPIHRDDKKVTEDVLSLSQTAVFDKVRGLVDIELLRHLSLFEWSGEFNSRRTNIRNGLAALTLGVAASVATGVGVIPALGLGVVSAYAGAKSQGILSGLLEKSLPETLEYTALSDSVFYAFNDRSSTLKGRLVGRASSQYGYLLFKLDAQEKGPVAYCDFDLNDKELPIAAANLVKLADYFREYYAKGVLSLERLVSIIKTMRSAKLNEIPLVNGYTIIFLVALLKGEAAFEMVVDELLANKVDVRTFALSHLRYFRDYFSPRLLKTPAPLKEESTVALSRSQYRWPVQELRTLATTAKLAILCGDCMSARGNLFQGIVEMTDKALDHGFVSLSAKVFEHLYYPSVVKNGLVTCENEKPIYASLLDRTQKDVASALYPLLASVKQLPDLEGSFEAAESQARRNEFEKMLSRSQVLVRMYALSTKVLQGALPTVTDESDVMRVIDPDLLAKGFKRGYEELTTRQEVALLRHHFVLKLFRRAKEQKAQAHRQTASTVGCAVATLATGVFLGPLSALLMLAPSYRLVHNGVTLLRWEFEKSPSVELTFQGLSSEVSYAYSNTSSGLGGTIKGKASESAGYLMFNVEPKMLFCPFELYNDEPIAPDELWKLREELRERLQQGHLSLTTLRSIIQTLASVSLPQTSGDPAPKLLNKQSSVYLSSLLTEYLSYLVWKDQLETVPLDERKMIRKVVLEAIQEDLYTTLPETLQLLQNGMA